LLPTPPASPAGFFHLVSVSRQTGCQQQFRLARHGPDQSAAFKYITRFYKAPFKSLKLVNKETGMSGTLPAMVTNQPGSKVRWYYRCQPGIGKKLKNRQVLERARLRSCHGAFFSTLNRVLRFGMGLVVHLHQAVDTDVGVFLGGGEGGVAQ